MPNGQNPVQNALSFDIEDWFNIVDIPELEKRENWSTFGSIVIEHTEQILRTLERNKVRATFFILGWIADKYPELVMRIHSSGHEIGSHSFWHRRIYLMPIEDFRKDTRDSLDAIEAACGVRPVGYRAPSFSILKGTEWALDVLLDCGIRWDASLFSGSRGHGGYDCPNHPFLANNLPSGREIPEIPLGNLHFGPLNLCFSGGGYLRALPYWAIDLGFKSFEKMNIPVVVYLHPRDFAVNCPRVPMSLFRSFKSYTGLGTTMLKLERLLANYSFTTCGTVLNLAGLIPDISEYSRV